MREKLALNIYQIRKDLYSLSTAFPESADVMRGRVRKAEIAINAWFNCHHTTLVNDRLFDLQAQIADYSRSVKEAIVLR